MILWDWLFLFILLAFLITNSTQFDLPAEENNNTFLWLFVTLRTVNFKNEVTIHTLPDLKCIGLKMYCVKRHLPLKTHSVGFRAFESPLYEHRRANRSDLPKIAFQSHVLPFTRRQAKRTDWIARRTPRDRK